MQCGSPLRSGGTSSTDPQVRPDSNATFSINAAQPITELSTRVDSSQAGTASAQPITKFALIAVGGLILGLMVGLTLRELGVLDFVLGQKVARDAAEEQARSSYDDGKEVGDEAGYSRGYEEGKSAGFSEGDTTGYERGYNTGLDVGFIDSKAGITPTDVGSFGISVEWSDMISSPTESGLSGICVFTNGNNLQNWDGWKWAFISTSGSINFMSDSNGDYNCYVESRFRSDIGSLQKYNRLAVYLTIDGKTDRWGPLPIPSP